MVVDSEASARVALVAAAVERWVKDLIDIGKRNPLLYFRDLKVGTLALDTDEVNPGALTALHAGRTVPMSALFASEDARADARRRLRVIRKKIRELHEERGIDAGHVAVGLATWQEPQGLAGRLASPPAAPVLMRQLTLQARSAAEDDFDLSLAEDVVVNPVLLHVLAEEHNSRLDGDELTSLIPVPTFDPEPVFERLRKLASSVPGFAIDNRTVLGTFSYAKLPMVKDLQQGLELLVESDVVAALAGDPAAQAALRGSGGGTEVQLNAPDATPPADEFLVRDADSSQSYAINAVVAGHHVVIKGPPGTGKSQTITNLVATLVARGQRVLFVAEKRAAIDAVLSRLHQADLGTWVMDLHEGLSNRRKVAQDLATTLERAARTAPPHLASLHRELTSNRERLLAHDRTLHTPRAPWGLTIFELQSWLLGLDGRGVTFRLRGPQLPAATEDVVAAAKAAIEEYADLGGLAAASESPWAGAPVATSEQARAALDTAVDLRGHTVPEVTATLHNIVTETGLPEPGSVAEWQGLFTLLDRTAEVLGTLSPAVFDADLQSLTGATATRSWRKQNQVLLRWGARRRLTKQARALSLGPKPSRKELHTRLVQAWRLNYDWRQICLDGAGPRLPGDLGGAHAAYERLGTQLRALAAHLQSGANLEQTPSEALPDRLERLIADRETLAKLPRRNALEHQLATMGFAPLLAECRTRGVDPDAAAEVLEATWLASILDELAVTDTAYGSFQGATLNRAVQGFQQYDHQHIDTTATRVQRHCAERLYQALDAHPDQATLLRSQASRKRGHLSMRQLLGQAPDVLLSLKPCWAMSPLVVSQVLPMAKLFDVVIFDEASQVPPADAIPSIARGHRVVVAGDERQLPPTSFFAAATTSDDDGDGSGDDGAADAGEVPLRLTSGYESVLDALSPVVPMRNLQWHYRSQDERLIAFSNAHIYDSSLTTFPGAHTDGVLRHVHVPFVAGAPGSEESATAEVSKVADLVIEHAETRPEESLGVIAMGIKHADRIEAAVRDRIATRRDLDDFFSESREERFFVKNLERVQGDERDAVILSVGYGKSPDGRMQYTFGPLNNEGGERRLNVAVSRAKRRMTLVSSFSSADLDPNKLKKRGAELLGAYLTFMESGGSDLGSVAAVPPALNPFEQDVRDRLVRAGIPVTAQYGVSGYRIDFVAAHPTQPGRMVLAIEADGAAYHSSPTARDRDRLRQEHLERLGWRFHRIWSTDWFRQPDTEVAKVQTAYHAAVLACDEGRVPTRPPAPVTTDAPATGSTTGAAPVRKLRRPSFRPGHPITDYSQRQLVEVIRWIESDDLLRTEDDLLIAAMAELGFRKRGSRIVAALQAAIGTARASR